jgi:hydrogenase nickel incorporation protein HypA/HybF
MHEVSIAHHILDAIGDKVGGQKPLDAVYLTVGPLSGVSPEALEFCFGLVAGERGFGSPSLVIQKPCAQAVCGACALEYQLDDMYTLCPGCGSLQRQILSGNEFTVDSVEIKENLDV